MSQMKLYLSQSKLVTVAETTFCHSCESRNPVLFSPVACDGGIFIAACDGRIFITAFCPPSS